MRSHDVTAQATSADIGVTKVQTSRWQTEARVPEDEFAELVGEAHGAGKELTHQFGSETGVSPTRLLRHD